MSENRHNGHSVTRLAVHVGWVTKYRFVVLQGDIKQRCRDLLVQICDAEDMRILKGVESRDHVPMLMECLPSKAVREIVRRLTGGTSRR